MLFCNDNTICLLSGMCICTFEMDGGRQGDDTHFKSLSCMLSPCRDKEKAGVLIALQLPLFYRVNS